MIKLSYADNTEASYVIICVPRPRADAGASIRVLWVNPDGVGRVLLQVALVHMLLLGTFAIVTGQPIVSNSILSRLFPPARFLSSLMVAATDLAIAHADCVARYTAVATEHRPGQQLPTWTVSFITKTGSSRLIGQLPLHDAGNLPQLVPVLASMD